MGGGVPSGGGGVGAEDVRDHKADGAFETDHLVHLIIDGGVLSDATALVRILSQKLSELGDLHVLSKQVIDDLASIDLLLNRQLLHEVSDLAIEIDRQIEFAVRVVESISYAF